MMEKNDYNMTRIQERERHYLLLEPLKTAGKTDKLFGHSWETPHLPKILLFFELYHQKLYSKTFHFIILSHLCSSTILVIKEQLLGLSII